MASTEHVLVVALVVAVEIFALVQASQALVVQQP
jgi:hypothetical protein